jgi:hypothetical protein
MNKLIIISAALFWLVIIRYHPQRSGAHRRGLRHSIADARLFHVHFFADSGQ